MTTDWPIKRPKGSEIKRADVSTNPPGGTGTTRVIGLLGKAWAIKANGAHRVARASSLETLRRVFMVVFLDGVWKSAHANLGVVEDVFGFAGQAAPVLVL